MESEEAILENENNFNVELESTLRDRDPQQAGEERLDSHDPDTSYPPDVSPARVTRDETGIVVSGDGLKSDVHEGFEASSFGTGEPMVQGESCKSEKAAATSTPLAESREESLQDYEDFIGNDDMSSDEGNAQFKVSENDNIEKQPQDDSTEKQPQDDSTEKQPQDDSTEKQPQDDSIEKKPQDDSTEKQPQAASDAEFEEPMDMDICAGASAADRSEQTGIIEQVSAHENIDPSVLQSDDERDHKQCEKTTIEYETSEAVDPFETDQPGPSKCVPPVSADLVGDLLEHLENTASGQANTVLEDKKSVPGFRQHDNVVQDVSKGVETPFCVEANMSVGSSNLDKEDAEDTDSPHQERDKHEFISLSNEDMDNVKEMDSLNQDRDEKDKRIDSSSQGKNKDLTRVDSLDENRDGNNKIIDISSQDKEKDLTRAGSSFHDEDKDLTDTESSNEDQEEEVLCVDSSTQDREDGAEEVVDLSHQDKGIQIRGVENAVVVRDEDVTDVVRDEDVTDVVRDEDVTDVVRDENVTDVVRDEDVTDIFRDEDVTDVVRDEDVTDVVRDEDVTDVVMGEDVTDVNSEKQDRGMVAEGMNEAVLLQKSDSSAEMGTNDSAGIFSDTFPSSNQKLVDAGIPKDDFGVALGEEHATKEASSEAGGPSREEIRSDSPGSKDVAAGNVLDDAGVSVDHTSPGSSASAECRNQTGAHFDVATEDEEMLGQVKISVGDSKSSSESDGEKSETRQIASSESQNNPAVDASVHNDSISKDDAMEVTTEVTETGPASLQSLDKTVASERPDQDPDLGGSKHDAELLHGEQNDATSLHISRIFNRAPGLMDVVESTVNSPEAAPEIGVVEAPSPPAASDSSERNSTQDKGAFDGSTDVSCDSVASPLAQGTSSTSLTQDASPKCEVQDASPTPQVPDTSPTPQVPDTSPTPLVPDTGTKLKKEDLIPKTEADSRKSVKKEAVQKNVVQPKTEPAQPVNAKRPQRARRTGHKVEEKAALTPIKSDTLETRVNENGRQVKNSTLSSKQELLEDDEKSTITLASSDSKKTESRRSKSSRSRTQTCLVCQKICKCKYNIVRNGDVKHLCDDPCFKQFKQTPSTFLKGPDNSKPSKKSSKSSEATPPAQVKDTVITDQHEMESRQSATYKTCAVCQLLNLNASQPFCNWKGLDFCGESCLGKFQANLNSVCSFCHAVIPVDTRPGCCVKIGADMHLFCKQRCCNEFKKKLRLCSFCQRDVAGILGAFSAMVGKAGKLKEFCSQACMRKLESRMKEFDLILVEKGSSVTCFTCRKNKPLKYNVWLKGKSHTLCSDVCLSVFKHTNNISTDACDNCGAVCSSEEAQSHFVQYAGQLKQFCSDMCVSHFCKANSRVESCDWCRTKKMNFDMIERQDAESKFMMFCSLNCLALCRVTIPTKTGRPVACDQCRKVEPAQYHLTMSDASKRNYCSYPCVLTATNRTSPGAGSLSSVTPASHQQPQQPVTQTQQQKIPPPSSKPVQSHGRAPINTRQAAARQQSQSVPIISNVVSLASPGEQNHQRQPNLRSTPNPPPSLPPQPATPKAAPSHPVPAQPALPPSPASSQVPSPNVNTPVGITRAAAGNMVPSADGKHQILIQSPPPKVGKNRSLQCKPVMQTKATSCKPHSQIKGTQTDELPPKTVFVPVPVPVYVPMPTVMYSAPAPKLIPVPIPIPVPIFIPTTRKSVNGIFKTIQDILERMPADPLEAELLMMAEAVAADGRPGDSDTDSEADTIAEDFTVPAVPEDVLRPAPREDDALLLRKRERQGEEDMIQMALRMAEEMSGPIEDLETSVEPIAVNSEAPPQQQQQHTIQSYENQADDDYIPPRSVQRVPKRASRGRSPMARGKKPRMDRPYNEDASIQSQSAMQMQSMEPPPDANYRLKFTYGVNAWRHWIINKNAEIEKAKQATGNYKLRSFPSDLLKCMTDDLNNTLCMFIKEVRKPNGDEYSPDSICYLCLGIQQYLFENGRIENIFTDVYFEKFTDCLNDILKTLRPKVNSQGQMLCRIEEEHLWESKQLGAHSPFILLNTLIYFHTKHFILKTAQEHMSLSFAQILKHWKKGMPLKGQSAVSGKNVSLRFYCLANGKKDGLAARKNKDGLPVYEVTENFDNPLRCPVKLYEFFLSKCPESIKNRNDIFYPVPERSCVPDSPVWYSTQSIDIHTMDKMLTRVLLVREIQEAHLHAQPVYM